MQWDLAAQSDAAVISSRFAPPQRASLGTSATALPLGSVELEVPYYLNAHYWWGTTPGFATPSWQKWESRCRGGRCRSHVSMVT